VALGGLNFGSLPFAISYSAAGGDWTSPVWLICGGIGVLVGVLVTATNAAFVVYLLGQFRRARRGDLPDYRLMRHRALSLVALGDVALLVAPFLG
jgi:hypothetical protein